MTFGEKLKSLREERGMSQVALAKRMGMDRKVIIHTESGLREPNLRTIFYMAIALNVSIQELMDGVDDY